MYRNVYIYKYLYIYISICVYVYIYIYINIYINNELRTPWGAVSGTVGGARGTGDERLGGRGQEPIGDSPTYPRLLLLLYYSQPRDE